jgi:hypothetical protein
VAVFCPDASAAIIAAVDFPPPPFFLACDRGFQCRNAVQGLHGLLSGPRTKPGGTPSFKLEDEDGEVGSTIRAGKAQDGTFVDFGLTDDAKFAEREKSWYAIFISTPHISRPY